MARFAAAALLLLPALTARAAAMAPVPAAASGHWRVGSLDLAPCDIGGRHATGVPTQAAYCTTFDVPEDWDTPQGRHIGLRVALVRGSAPDNDPDIVAFLDGGPGGAATEDYPPIAPALAPLRKRHHLLLVDQRGTGGSNALDCGDDIALDTDKPAPPARAATFSGAPRRAAGEPGPAQRRAATQRCIAALAPRAALQFYTTTDAVRDLEAVRQALGGPPLDLVGVSYGTRVAQHYAARYPQSVRSIVLDSPVPNRLALPGEHARNMEDALRQRLARCGATPACAQRFGDSYAAAHLVHERLRRQDVAVELADPLSFALAPRRLGADDFAQLLRFYLYSDATSALLPLVIDAARAGRYAPVLGQVRLVVGDVAEHLSNGMAASVMCTEDADLLEDRAEDAATLLGPGLVQSAREACALWPRRARPADFHEALRTALPVLVLSGQYDPVTPPRYATEIVAGLEHARLLLAPGQGHAVLGAGCMPKLVAAFVRDLDPARIDDSCLQVLGDTPAFLSVNGARP